jgi:hypothetical protein
MKILTIKKLTTREADIYKKLSPRAQWLIGQELAKGGEELTLTAAIDAILSKVAERRVTKGKYEGDRPDWAEPTDIFSPIN